MGCRLTHPYILKPDDKGMIVLVICNLEGSTKKLSLSQEIENVCNLEDELVTQQVSMVRSRHSDSQDCKSYCFSQKKKWRHTLLC